MTGTEYTLLVAAGHSPAKALEITIDAKRGDPYALRWIEIALLKETDCD